MAGAGIDEGQVVLEVVKNALPVKIELGPLVDSKDIIRSISIQRNSIDKSIRSDVGAIPYKLKTKFLKRFNGYLIL